MAKKKNLNKKLKRKKQQRVMALSFDELMHKGDIATASGKPREAIKLYKMAIKDLKSQEQTQRLHHKMFLAYLDRIKELNAKNMMVEAASLRKQHTYASLLIDQGENIKYIQTQLGHSNPTVTLNVYAHLMKPTNQESAQRLERMILCN